MHISKVEERFLKKLPLGFLIMLLLFMVALFVVGFIAHEVLYEEEYELDRAVAAYVSEQVVTPALTRFMRVMAFMASSTFLLPAYTLLTIFYLVIKQEKILGLGIALIGITGYIITHSLKNLFGRERPQDQLTEILTNFSFPSGHSVSAFLFYGLLVYLIWNTKLRRVVKIVIAIFLFVLAILIGCSRIYLGVHYTTDVIAGFCIGFAWLLLSIWLIEKLLERRRKRKSPEFTGE